MDESLGGLTHN